ncbi:ankyrin repeat domain-containing protein [Aquimarina sp. 2304DJ70-9]|uniref:ankyrin repeat domain-containing protein n=1 Tax=Aquimarina penaris TaxID=3231044 RepID=UPI003462FD7F
MKYLKESKYIWDKFVPTEGKADTVQGELLRSLEKLRWEAQNNGNKNWDERFEDFADYISDTLCTSGIFNDKARIEIQRSIDCIKDFEYPEVKDDIYDCISDYIVEWYLDMNGEIPEEARTKQDEGAYFFRFEKVFKIVNKILLPKSDFRESEMFPEVILKFPCKKCNETNEVKIIPFKTGTSLDILTQKKLISKEELIKNGVAKSAAKFQSHLGELIFCNLPALYEGFKCSSCSETYLIVFGSGESQPGRMTCQISGIWKVEFDDINLEALKEEIFGHLIYKRDTELKKILEKYPARIDEFIKSGYNGLMHAVIDNNIEIVKLYLTYGADPNLKDKTNDSAPLHYAVDRHNYEIVRLLLEYKAEVNSLDSYGNNALFAALKSRNEGREIIDLLLEYDVDKAHKNHYGNSAEDRAKRFKFKL